MMHNNLQVHTNFCYQGKSDIDREKLYNDCYPEKAKSSRDSIVTESAHVMSNHESLLKRLIPKETKSRAFVPGTSKQFLPFTEPNVTKRTTIVPSTSSSSSSFSSSHNNNQYSREFGGASCTTNNMQPTSSFSHSATTKPAGFQNASKYNSSSFAGTSNSNSNTNSNTICNNMASSFSLPSNSNDKYNQSNNSTFGNSHPSNNQYAASNASWNNNNQSGGSNNKYPSSNAGCNNSNQSGFNSNPTAASNASWNSTNQNSGSNNLRTASSWSSTNQPGSNNNQAGSTFTNWNNNTNQYPTANAGWNGTNQTGSYSNQTGASNATWNNNTSNTNQYSTFNAGWNGTNQTAKNSQAGASIATWNNNHQNNHSLAYGNNQVSSNNPQYNQNGAISYGNNPPPSQNNYSLAYGNNYQSSSNYGGNDQFSNQNNYSHSYGNNQMNLNSSSNFAPAANIFDEYKSNPNDPEVSVHVTPTQISVMQKRELALLKRKDFNWDSLLHLRKAVFGHSQFRPGQVSAIHATMTNRDVFVLMPTGGGKSLCYQLPAMASPGITFVISPLVSLVHDQVSALNLNGDQIAIALKSYEDQSPEQFREDMNLIKNNQVKMVYVTPEKLSHSTYIQQMLVELNDKGLLARFVIDEAHCVSSWGHDFRNDYLKLSNLRRNYPGVPIMALTATATTLVIKDTINLLKLNQPEVIRLSFNRPNLRYEVLKKPSYTKTIASVVEYIRSKHINQCGIVYCLSRNDCERVASDLQGEFGKNYVEFYHAGIDDPGERQRRQDLWSNDRIRVIVATVAFGMGIDKPQVRFVIHFSMPKSITNFYQESGRAGRDGKIAECLIYYSYKDKLSNERLIRKSSYPQRGGGNSKNTKVQLQIKNLNRMVEFCENEVECRRKIILQYFSETFNKVDCHKTCDNCRADYDVNMRNVTQFARDFAQVVEWNCNRNVTSIVAVDLLKGSNRKGMERYNANNLHSKYKSENISLLHRVVHHLVCENYIEEFEKGNAAGYSSVYCRLGPNAHQLRGANVNIVIPERMKQKRQSAKAPKVDEVIVDEDLKAEWNHPRLPPKVQEGLKMSLYFWREQLGNENGVHHGYRLIDDKAIEEVTRRVPQTIQELKDVSSIGDKKAEKYGDNLLKVIKQNVMKPGIEIKGNFVFKPAVINLIASPTQVTQSQVYVDVPSSTKKQSKFKKKKKKRKKVGANSTADSDDDFENTENRSSNKKTKASKSQANINITTPSNANKFTHYLYTPE